MSDVQVRPIASVKALKFWQKFTPDGPEGELRAVDWVEFCPTGEQKYSIIPEAVARLQKRTDGVWEAIQPAYDAWKSGLEIPLHGTPLAAWPGVTTEQADVLKANGIRTVEEIAALTDAQITRVRLPGMRELKVQAMAYDAAKGNRSVEAALSKKDEEIEALRQQMADMMALLSNGGEAPKNKGGRPRKDRSDDAETEAA